MKDRAVANKHARRERCEAAKWLARSLSEDIERLIAFMETLPDEAVRQREAVDGAA